MGKTATGQLTLISGSQGPGDVLSDGMPQSA